MPEDRKISTDGMTSLIEVLQAEVPVPGCDGGCRGAKRRMHRESSNRPDRQDSAERLELFFVPCVNKVREARDRQA